MEKIILGLLMLKRMTVYEIRNIVRRNFQSISSDSLGSIQSAVKKLATAGLLTCEEFVERSVNKKRYSITAEGRRVFSEWLLIPADLTDTKNMELGKLMYMGFVPAGKRPELIDGVISRLEEELTALQTLFDSSKDIEPSEKAVAAYWMNDKEYLAGVQQASQCDDISENIRSIAFFQLMSLQYGIDSIKHNIGWFKALKEKLDEEGRPL